MCFSYFLLTSTIAQLLTQECVILNNCVILLDPSSVAPTTNDSAGQILGAVVGMFLHIKIMLACTVVIVSR